MTNNTSRCEPTPNVSRPIPPHGTTPPSATPCLWQYSLTAGWTQVPSPLPSDDDSLDGRLADAGFDVLVDWTHDMASLSPAIFHHGPTDRFYVALTGVLAVCEFLVADTPSMLALLPGLLAMAKDADALDAAERERSHQAEHHGHGPTHNTQRRTLGADS